MKRRGGLHGRAPSLECVKGGKTRARKGGRTNKGEENALVSKSGWRKEKRESPKKLAVYVSQ